MTELLPLNTTPLPVKLRVEDYLLLDGAGAFAAYRKTELLGGDIFYMNAQHRPHSYTKSEFAYRLRRSLEEAGNPLYVLTESSAAIPPHDAPAPDILLTSEPRGEGLVPVASIALVVEIADATLHSDLTRKQAIYAGAGIAEYWVLDINARIVRQMTDPAGDAYSIRHETPFGEPVAALTLAGLTVRTDRL